MIDSSAAYKEAVVADSRRTYARAVVYIVDPDITYGTITDSGETALSDKTQLLDRTMDLGQPYATLELNRWALDGSSLINTASGQVGVESSGLYDDEGDGSEWVLLPFSNVDVLQTCSIYFSSRVMDGWPVDLTVEILVGGVAVHTETITDNTDRLIKVSGFTVYSPEGIRVTVTKWSLPYMRMRTAEIIAGIYEVWDGDSLADLDVTYQADFSLLTLPYSTAKISIDNSDKRFDPRNKTGLFQSIEDRQPVELYIGVGTPSGPEYIPAGVFYQYDGGWRASNNAAIMKWTLADTIGLLQGRRYSVPVSLPTKLSGWVSDLVGQLGTAFSGHYYIDPGYENLALTASSSALENITCGQVMMWLCQAARLTARSDPRNGYLRFEPYRDGGIQMTLDNLTQYPTMYANGDIAEMQIKAGGSTYVYTGTSTSSPTTVSIQNPFVSNQTKADAVAQYIISTFGGNRIECIGRGDPTSEIGDVATVQLDASSATTGRIFYLRHKFTNGVLQGCTAKMLQASGASLYENRQQFTADGTFTVPAGVTQLRLVLVGKGEDGGQGAYGGAAPASTTGAISEITVGSPGARGTNGLGGKVWTGIISVNPGVTYSITISSDTTFASYSSANGVRYPNGFKDAASGDSFARPGVASPAAGSGDGGRGGAGGLGGRKIYRYGVLISETAPTSGSYGATGATGSCVIYWEDAS